MTVWEALWLLVWTLAGAFLIPLFLFRIVAICTYAFYVGRHRFRRDHQHDRRTNGQRTGKT